MKVAVLKAFLLPVSLLLPLVTHSLPRFTHFPTTQGRSDTYTPPQRGVRPTGRPGLQNDRDQLRVLISVSNQGPDSRGRLKPRRDPRPPADRPMDTLGEFPTFADPSSSPGVRSRVKLTRTPLEEQQAGLRSRRVTTPPPPPPPPRLTILNHKSGGALGLAREDLIISEPKKGIVKLEENRRKRVQIRTTTLASPVRRRVRVRRPEISVTSSPVGGAEKVEDQDYCHYCDYQYYY